MSKAQDFVDAAALAAKLRAYSQAQAKVEPQARVRLAQPLAYREAEALQGLNPAVSAILAAPKPPAAMLLPAEGSLAATLPQAPFAPSLGGFQAQIQGCEACALGKKRKRFVFGEGPEQARLLILGDAPGKDEDDSGRPFSGNAGKLLDRMLSAMGSSRQRAYLMHVVRCRTAPDQPASAEELAACRPYLEHQAGLLKPAVIFALGEQAVQALLGQGPPLAQRRGKFGQWRGIPVMPTFHPSAILSDEGLKRPVWEDMKLVVALLSKSL